MQWHRGHSRCRAAPHACPGPFICPSQSSWDVPGPLGPHPGGSQAKRQLHVAEEPPDTERCQPVSPRSHRKCVAEGHPLGGHVRTRQRDLRPRGHQEADCRLDEGPVSLPTCWPGWPSSPDSRGVSPSSLCWPLAAPTCERALPPVRIRPRTGHLGLNTLKCWGLSTPLQARPLGPLPEWSGARLPPEPEGAFAGGSAWQEGGLQGWGWGPDPCPFPTPWGLSVLPYCDLATISALLLTSGRD